MGPHAGVGLAPAPGIFAWDLCMVPGAWHLVSTIGMAHKIAFFDESNVFHRKSHLWVRFLFLLRQLLMGALNRLEFGRICTLAVMTLPGLVWEALLTGFTRLQHRLNDRNSISDRCGDKKIPLNFTNFLEASISMF